MTDAPTPPPNGERDAQGRFLPGNTTCRGGANGGRLGGNPHVRKLAEVQAVVREHGTPEAVGEMLELLRTMGRAGDRQAVVEWLHRVCGRPREAAPKVDVDLADIDLTTSAGIAQALVALLRGAAAGALDLAAARDIAALVDHVAAATTIAELDRRVAEIERQRRHAP